MSEASARRSPSWPWLVLACLPLLGFWLYGLFDVDEGFYAAVTREMLWRNDWITPYYNGLPWFEKPILIYWAAAPCVAAFGETIGPRLPSILATVGLLALCGSFARRRLGDLAGKWGTLVLGTSLITVLVGRMMLADPLLVLFLSATFFFWWRSLKGCGWWRVWAGACLGTAVLAKGPVAIAVFGAVWLCTLVAERDLRKSVLSVVDNLGALIAMLFVISLWYVPCYMANGQRFVDEFLIAQNIGRFKGGDAAHPSTLLGIPWYIAVPIYYPLTLAAGMLPWWPLARKSAPAEAPDPDADAARRMLWRWFWVVLVFFTVSGSKLPHYIYSAVPPLALIIGERLSRREWMGAIEGLPKFAIAVPVLVCLLINSVGIVYYATSGQEELHSLAKWARTVGPEVVSYKLGRQSKDRGTGKLDIQETSKPSLVFYVGNEVPMVDSMGLWLAPRKTALFLSREGRIGDAEIAEAEKRNMSLIKMKPPVETWMYEVWLLDPNVK